MRRETVELLRRVNHEAISPSDPRARPPPRRPADRVDRPLAVAPRAPADHGRAVGDPRRQRDRDALRRRPPAHRRRRRRRLHLPPARRDQPDRRPGHGAERGARPSPRACRPRPAPTTLVTHMVGRELEQLFPDRPQATGDVLLEVRGLRRLPDVKEASFELRAGEVLGIAGLVGAGRSELLRAIYGVDRRDAGEVAGRRCGAAAAPARRGDRRRARPRPGGPQVAGAAARVGPDQERHAARHRPLPAGPDPCQGRAGGRRGAARRAPHHAVGRRPARPRAVRRQPAEGRARPLAASPVPRAAARRADARRRRRAPRPSCSGSSPASPSRGSACWSCRRRSRS